MPKHRKDAPKHRAEHVERETAAAASRGSQSITAATAQALLAKFGVTEQEAQALLDQPDVSDAEVAVALLANIPAISSAFSPSTTAALAGSDTIKIKSTSKSTLVATADRVRLIASATSKVDAIHAHGVAGAHVDVGVLQKVEYEVAPQIKVQLRYDDTLATTFASLLAYHHVRSPGRHGHAAAPVTTDKRAPK